MSTTAKKIAVLAVVGGLGLVVVPFLIPTGPDTGFDPTALLASGQFFVAAALIFGLGLLTALTPCVYPLIPITVGVFGARKAESKTKAVLLTSSYVVGMGVVFSTLGVTAALTGKAFGSVLANPWVLTGLAVFMLVLAASMFGAFEITLPAGLAQKLNGVGGAGFLGAFLMGSVSGFLAAPCTGPVLTGLLTYVAKGQNVAAGAGFMFIYALGIGAPFFLIGVFAMRLPKSGEWMDWVKSLFGIALVAMAAMYEKDAIAAARGGLASLAEHLGRIPGAWIAGATAAVGIALGAVHLSFKTERWPQKAAAILVVVAAVVVRLSVLNVAPATAHGAAEFVWDFQYPQNGTGLDAVLARARADHQPVMMDFGADWCAACKELERETYVAEPVVKASHCFTTIKVDGTNEGDDLDALYKRYGVQGLPTVVFLAGDGRVLNDPRVTGFLSPEKFLVQMEKVKSLSPMAVCSR